MRGQGVLAASGAVQHRPKRKRRPGAPAGPGAKPQGLARDGGLCRRRPKHRQKKLSLTFLENLYTQFGQTLPRKGPVF